MSVLNLQDRFQTPPQVARLLKTSVEQVHGWIASGELKAVNLSGGQRPRWKINPSDLELFLEGRSNRAASLDRKPRKEIPTPKRNWFS